MNQFLALQKDFIYLLAVLDPAIKIFISVATILGPLSIISMVIILKLIQKRYPEKIRWK